jgi:hypothetical protein
MVNRIAAKIRTYPVTFWAGVGVFSYLWKASIVATMYEKTYSNFEQQRQEELTKLK